MQVARQARPLLFLRFDDALRQRVLADVDTLSDAALRTLAVAYRPLEPDESPQAEGLAAPSIERDLIYVGTVGIIDPPRAGSRASSMRSSTEASP